MRASFNKTSTQLGSSGGITRKKRAFLANTIKINKISSRTN